MPTPQAPEPPKLPPHVIIGDIMPSLPPDDDSDDDKDQDKDKKLPPSVIYN